VIELGSACVLVQLPKEKLRHPTMKFCVLAWALLLGGLSPVLAVKKVASSTSSPIAKVIELLINLQGKVIANGEREQTIYKEYVEWCKDSAFVVQQELRDRASKKEEDIAVSEKASTDATELSSQIQHISGSVATDEADLKAVTLLREKENIDFKAVDIDLSSALDILKRARRVLAKGVESTNKQAVFLSKPTQGMEVFVATLNELAKTASVLSSEDGAALQALIQDSSRGEAEAGSDDEDDLEMPAGSPAEYAYTHHSDNILDQLEDLQDRFEDTQEEARKKERTSRHNFEMLKQDLEGKVKVQKEELSQARIELARANELKANTDKKINTHTSLLKDAKAELERLQRGCMQRATEFSEEVGTRKAEMKALAEAKRALQDSSGNAAAVYTFVQVERIHTSHAGSNRHKVGVTVVKQLRQLAKQTGKVALVQLASRVLAAMRAGLAQAGEAKDPFVKVRTLIENMIARLQKDASAATEQKEFCDHELGRATGSRDAKQDKVDEQSTRMESVSAEVAKQEDEVKEFFQELADLSRAQVKLDKLRTDEHASYLQRSKELKEGLAGVQMALKILRDYYGSTDDSDGAIGGILTQEDVGESMEEVGTQTQVQAVAVEAPPSAGSGIIGLLEVVESDFAKLLTEAQSIEDSSAQEHKRYMQDSTISRKLKEDLAERTKSEIIRLRKTASELDSDRSASQDELDAIVEYLSRLQAQCVKPADTYEQRTGRREVEIAGLREALATLEGTA